MSLNQGSSETNKHVLVELKFEQDICKLVNQSLGNETTSMQICESKFARRQQIEQQRLSKHHDQASPT